MACRPPSGRSRTDRAKYEVRAVQADDHEHHPARVPELLVEDGRGGPEVHHDDPQAVERVVEERGAHERLPHPADRAGVEPQDLVVEAPVRAHQPDVEHVEKDERPDGDAGDPVECPCEHSFAASVLEVSHRETRLRGGPGMRRLAMAGLVRVDLRIVGRRAGAGRVASAACATAEDTSRGTIGSRYAHPDAGAAVKIQEADAKSLLAAQGLPVPPWAVARTPAEARAAAGVRATAHGG